MGAFCIIAGIIIGAISSFSYGPIDFLTTLRIYFVNFYSTFGYVFLGLGLIAYFIKRKFKKISMQGEKATPHSTFKEFVDHTVNEPEEE